jgi:uncharacterized protein YdaU (DUF1376 family)
MKKITVSVDDATYRRARAVAAERGTTVPALINTFLSELRSSESEFERLRRLEQQLRQQVPPNFRASDNLTRDQLYDRAAMRSAASTKNRP